MFIDYLTLMLTNMVAGLCMLGAWIYLDLNTERQRRWVPGFLMTGLLSSLTGLHMIFTWPLPGSFNILFGEMSVFFGVLMLGLALVILMKLDLLPIAIYGTVVGIAAIIIGIQVLNLGLTQSPPLAGAAFIWVGLIGLFSIPMLGFQHNKIFRVLCPVGLAVAAILWGFTGYNAYWGHVKPFSKWKPVQMEYQIKMQNPAKK